MNTDELLDLEIKLLLEGIFRVYGYDFREYAEASLRRRLIHWLAGSGFDSFSHAQAELLRDRKLFECLLRGITVNVSEMFRDPSFFKTLREQVIPHLKTYPFVKIWHAGCATGEEAYSMAILLLEEGLRGRFRIYATDINDDVLRKAHDSIYPLKDMQRFTRNYQQSGGTGSFSDYYTAKYDHAILNVQLRDNIVFAAHNLAVDSGFGEMNMILCRNVMIYFKRPLKEKTVRLFDSCLAPGGFLCLGSKESLEQHELADQYEVVAKRMQIYRKKYVKS